MAAPSARPSSGPPADQMTGRPSFNASAGVAKGVFGPTVQTRGADDAEVAHFREVIANALLLDELRQRRGRAVDDHDRETVRFGAIDPVEGGQAAGARLVFDHDRGGQGARDGRRDQPGVNVVAAAGAIADDKTDRFASKIGFIHRLRAGRRDGREHKAGHGGQSSRKRGHAIRLSMVERAAATVRARMLREPAWLGQIAIAARQS